MKSKKVKSKTSTPRRKTAPRSPAPTSVEKVSPPRRDMVPPLSTLNLSRRHNNYWLLLAILLVAAVGLLWLLPQSWLVKASFSGTKTYPFALVLGAKAGNLDAQQLNDQLARLKIAVEIRDITFANANDHWTFNSNKLGVTFDTQATSQAVWQLNKLSIRDKFRLLTGGISPAIKPAILVDSDKCLKTLSAISIPKGGPKDAQIYFDKQIKLKPDRPGTKYRATSNCRRLPEWLADNNFTPNVYLDTAAAKLTQADLEAKLPQIQAMAGQPLLLQRGAYKLTLTSKQLLALLDISKKGHKVQLGWSPARLDKLINDIAAHINTNNRTPALGNCQYLISAGGHWLNKSATNKFMQNLDATSPRTYSLPVSYHAPAIGKRAPVPPGKNGTVYLTFDDGLTYGNQIMDYAACYHIKVTFFELGTMVGADIAALHRAIAEGHAVQSHGYFHAAYDYGERSYSWQNNDIKQSISTITSVTGVRPTYFRPPGGNRSANTYKAASNNGLTLILWGTSSADTAGIGSGVICANVLAGIYPGASVLMHSIKSATAAAVPCIIEGLSAMGYNMQALR